MAAAEKSHNSALLIELEGSISRRTKRAAGGVVV
jgi:hypothetical protein